MLFAQAEQLASQNSWALDCSHSLMRGLEKAALLYWGNDKHNLNKAGFGVVLSGDKS